MAQENMRRVGKYLLVDYLGSGAISEVWKAFDTQLKRNVAMKFLQTELHTNAEAKARFEREAQNTASLHHSNIVQVYDVQLSLQNSSDIYMVMDYIEGGTLSEYIKQTSHQGNFPTPEELVRLFTSIAMAVDYAHQHKMIHRGIKPVNILLDSRNTTRNAMGEPMLADFSLVKIVGISTGTLKEQVPGTPLYMAPEQALGETSKASSDIYSLGVILYEMCTGVLPFHVDGQYDLLKQIQGKPPLPRSFNPKISDALQDVILRCIEKEPSQRYSSASALVLALARALSLPPPLEPVPDAAIDVQVQQQPIQQSELMQTQPDAIQSSPLFAREQTGQVPAKPRSTYGTLASVAHVLSAHTPVRKVPNPETPLPPVDEMASLFPSSQPLSQPGAVVQPSINHPVPSARPKVRRRRRIGVLLVVLLLLLVLISYLTLILLPEFHNGTGVVALASVGQVSFFSTKTLYYNSVDKKDEHAINDGLRGTFHLAPPAPGDSYYAWLRTPLAESSGMYLTSPHSGNALTTSDGVTTLYYEDAAHRNLLAPIDTNSDAYRIFMIEEQKTTNVPTLAAETLRYQAAIPDQPSSTSVGTYLSHIQHLLSSDPDLDGIKLRNGLDYWFLNNVNTVETLAEEIQSHTSANSLSKVQGWILTMLYYLDGKCATDDIKLVNTTIDATQQPYTLDDTKVSLLDCGLSPVVNVPGYINHMGTHLNYLEQMIGITTSQKQQIEQIKTSLSDVQSWLTYVRKDVLGLIQTYMNDLGNPLAMQLRYDMANNAELALSGQFDPQTQQLEQGAMLICDSIQHLASMPVTKV